MRPHSNRLPRFCLGLVTLLDAMVKASDAPIALLNAAPHKYGKAIVVRLAPEGFDIALSGLGKMKARAGVVEEHGQRGLAVRMNLNDPRGGDACDPANGTAALYNTLAMGNPPSSS